MVARIVEHDDRVSPPGRISGIKMVDQLGEEETEGLAVRDSAVCREVHLSCTAQCSDDVDRDQRRLGGHLVGL